MGGGDDGGRDVIPRDGAAHRKRAISRGSSGIRMEVFKEMARQNDREVPVLWERRKARETGGRGGTSRVVLLQAFISGG